MNVRNAQKLRFALLIAGFIIMLAGGIWGPLCTKIGIVVAFSSLIPTLLYNKCPHCGKQLGRNEGKFCHHCGEKID